MGERKLAIQEQYAWIKGGSRLKTIQAFQFWPLSVRLKTGQKKKVFQPLYGAISFFSFLWQTKDVVNVRGRSPIPLFIIREFDILNL